jgi:hypothetical protein
MMFAVALCCALLLSVSESLLAQEKEKRQRGRSRTETEQRIVDPRAEPRTKDSVARPLRRMQLPERQPYEQKLEIDSEQTGRAPYRPVFDLMQQGMSSGNITLFTSHFGSQVLVNLRGGESGYYSANQAYYVLEGYLRSRRILHFNFSSIGESESNPYATGSAGFNFKGSRENAQVYVSLSWVGDRWVITQINIY